MLGLYWYYQHKGIQAKPSAQVTNALDPAKYYAGRTTRDDPFPVCGHTPQRLQPRSPAVQLTSNHAATICLQPGSKGGAGGGHDTAGVITPAGTQQPPSTVDSISKTAGE